VAALEQGFMQDEIARSAYDYQRQIERKEKIIIGVNAYAAAETNSIPLFRVDDSIQQIQYQKLDALKTNRDPAMVDQVLQALNDKAAGSDNIMPAVLDAVEQKCTLGEIADELRSVFGEHK
jgi:methylmalonyl-CoA mutase, N-terminal domain